MRSSRRGVPGWHAPASSAGTAATRPSVRMVGSVSTDVHAAGESDVLDPLPLPCAGAAAAARGGDALLRARREGGTEAERRRGASWRGVSGVVGGLLSRPLRAPRLALALAGRGEDGMRAARSSRTTQGARRGASVWVGLVGGACIVTTRRQLLKRHAVRINYNNFLMDSFPPT